MTSNHNFESSFTQILNRTQQNLNRINQRYATSSSLSSSLSNIPSGNDVRTSSVGRSSMEGSASVYNLGERGGSTLLNRPNQSNEPSSLPTPPFHHSSSLHQHQQQQQRSLSSSSTQPTLSNSSSKNVMIDENLLSSILTRLTLLEKKEEENTSFLSTVSSQEKFMKSLDNNISSLHTDIKDLSRSFAQQNQKVIMLQSLYDSLTLDIEQRKNIFSKFENWIKETENWRETVDHSLSTSKKAEIFFSKHSSDLMKLLNESYITKYDFDSYRDKVYLLSQQAIQTTLSAWNDTNEQKMKNLEREIALMKLAQTQAVQNEMHSLSSMTTGGGEGKIGELGGSGGMTADIVAKVLGTPIPSEMVIKGSSFVLLLFLRCLFSISLIPCFLDSLSLLSFLFVVLFLVFLLCSYL
jgi:hypothetical protein